MRGFDADIVVVPEAWRDDDGAGMLDPLADDGYHVETIELMRLEHAAHAMRDRDVVPRDGVWELAVLLALPGARAAATIAMGTCATDPAGTRACALRVHASTSTATPVEIDRRAHVVEGVAARAGAAPADAARAARPRHRAADHRRRLQLLGSAASAC